MKLHYASHGVTRCGKAIAEYYLIETTSNPDEVTCKTCKKSLK